MNFMIQLVRTILKVEPEPEWFVGLKKTPVAALAKALECMEAF